MAMTLGQILINDALPLKYRDYERTLTKDEVDKLLETIAHDHPEQYRDIAHHFVQHGRETSFLEGATIKLSDLLPVMDKQEMLRHVDEQETAVRANKQLTAEQKEEVLSQVYGEVEKHFTDQTYAAAERAGNPLAVQVKSKAKGNRTQLAQLLTTPSVYQDSSGRTVPMFIRHSFAEGLTPAEYWAATHGARTGLVSTKLCLAQGTDVLMADYSTKPIEQIRRGEMALTVNTQGRTVPTEVTAVFNNGVRDCYRYTFVGYCADNPISICCTAEHKIRTIRRRPTGVHEPLIRMRPMHDLLKHRVYADLPAGCQGGVREPKAYLLGLLIGDGGLTRTETHFFTRDIISAGYLTRMLPAYNLKLARQTVREDGVCRYAWQEQVKSSGIGGGHKTPFRSWLRDLGLLGKRSYDKCIPRQVWTWDMRSVAELICGLIASDGSVNLIGSGNDSFVPALSIASSSQQLIYDVQRLLRLKLGIFCGKISRRECTGELSYFPGRPKPSVRTHDIFSIDINRREYVERIAAYWPDMADKKVIQLREWFTQFPRRRGANLGMAVTDCEFVGAARTYDIEVAADTHVFLLENGLVVSNSTRDGGYLGKQLGVAAITQIVTQDDCGTPYGVPVPAADPDNIGSVLARPALGFPAGTVVDKRMLGEFEKSKLNKVVVRSPMTCMLPEGLCKICVGHRENGRFPNIGDNIGLNAASAIAERIAQGALNVKHQGKKNKGEAIYAGFPVIEQLVQIPENFPHRAALADVDGKVESIDPAPQGGTNVMIAGQMHHVPQENELRVNIGDELEQGDQLSNGVVNPAEITRYKGIGEGRRYFAERFTQALRDSKFDVSRRNAEIISRALIDNVQVEDPEGVGSYLPGDIVSYSGMANTYKPRATAQRRPLAQAVGQYLETPVLHHTVGTRVTKQMAKDLKEFGIADALVHEQAPGFSPRMVSLVKKPQYERDWMAQLGSNYLEDRLLKSVHRGATSETHGLHPLPGMARTTEFGEQKKKDVFTY